VFLYSDASLPEPLKQRKYLHKKSNEFGSNYTPVFEDREHMHLTLVLYTASRRFIGQLKFGSNYTLAFEDQEQMQLTLVLYTANRRSEKGKKNMETCVDNDKITML